jgi:hypothetical protein
MLIVAMRNVTLLNIPMLNVA